MFTSVKLKNFMSFKDVTFDFHKGKDDCKRFIAIYGENGSGKSNFVKSLILLYQSIYSFQTLEALEQLNSFAHENNMPDELLKKLVMGMDRAAIMEMCRMIDSEEETEVRYGFKYGKHDGIYELKFTDQYSYERLYYFTGKQKGTIFEIRMEDGRIKESFSGKLFLNKKVKEEMENEIQKYWGRHTFLSILHRERIEKNRKFIQQSYLSYVFDLIDMINETTIHHKETSRSGNEFGARNPNDLLINLESGTIRKQNAESLQLSEKILNDFFTQAYADIKDVFYETESSEDKITYKLFVKKMIGGTIRRIPFEKESAGTQHILEIIRALLGVFCGATVVYDEIDDGIHDLLLKNILESMIPDITGQLIITTHNSYLLETIDPKSVYLIITDLEGNKEARCLDQYHIQPTNNPRVMYLKGMLGGVPITDEIDYDEIIQDLRLDTGDNTDGSEKV